MENAISRLLEAYEGGKLGRRELIRGLALLGAGSGVASAAGFQGVSLNHVSLYVSDLDKSSEFYQRAFGCVGRKRPDGTFEITLGKDHLVLRGGSPAGKIDHFAIGINNFNKDAVIADLKGRGTVPIDDGNAGAGLHVNDPDGFPVQLSANPA